jgi:nitrate/nitrite transport system substrate-binding protein
MTQPTDQTSRPGVSRRQLLKASAGAAALLAAAKLNLPGGAFAQGAGPEVKGAKLGFIALSDAGPLFVAKDKGLFAKHGMPDVEVLKQASWGTTRDNLVLGSEGNGIDGAHILTPMPYLISSGKVTQNNQPTPMYILARLNLDAQCISVSKEYADLKLGVDTAPFKVALDQGRDDIPGRHPRSVAALLARRRRH